MRIKKDRITGFVPGDTVYLNLRYFDGDSSAWFDALNLPEKEKGYYVQLRIRNWKNNRHSEVDAFCPVFNCDITLNNYDAQSVILTEEHFDDEANILVTEAFRRQYPDMFKE